MMTLMYRLARPLLFAATDPEQAHERAERLLRSLPFLARLEPPTSQRLNQQIFGHHFLNPLGLAAGFDKSGLDFPYTGALGFGFTEVGTFTLAAQEGNPRPRIFRLPQRQALFNRMGFNNPGIEQGLLNIRAGLQLSERPHILGISLGKSKATAPEAASQDYLAQLAILQKAENVDLHAHIAYIAINVSSPNTPGLRNLQHGHILKELVQACKQASPWPLLVKFAPDFSDREQFTYSFNTALEAGADGFVLTNTSSDYSILPELPGSISEKGGGISGRPLAPKSSFYLREAARLSEGKKLLVASGGIMSPQDAWQRLEDGASLVQLYTGFIYNGPVFARRVSQYIDRQMKERGLTEIGQIAQAKKTAIG